MAPALIGMLPRGYPSHIPSSSFTVGSPLSSALDAHDAAEDAADEAAAEEAERKRSAMVTLPPSRLMCSLRTFSSFSLFPLTGLSGFFLPTVPVVLSVSSPLAGFLGPAAGGVAPGARGAGLPP